MATDGQQRMLFAIAKANGLTTPARGSTAHLTNGEVQETKAALEAGRDVFTEGTEQPRFTISTRSDIKARAEARRPDDGDLADLLEAAAVALRGGAR